MTGGGVQPPSNNNQANNSNINNNNNTNSNTNNNNHHHHNGKKRSDSLNSTTSSAIFLDQDKPKFIEFTTSTPGGPIISSFISKIFHNNNSNPIPSASTQVGDSGDSSESNYYFYENPTNQNVSLFVSGNKLKLNESIKIKKKSLREPNIMDTENIEVNQLHLTRREKPSNSQLNTSNHTNNINASKIDMQNIDHLISRKKRSFSITKNSSNVIDTNDSSYSGFSLVNKKELLKMEHRVDLHASSRHNSTESLSRSKSHPELYKFLNTSEENIANENGSTPQSPTNNQSIPNGSGSGNSLLQPSSPSTPNNLSIDSPTHLPPTTQSIDSHQLHQTSPSQHDSVLTPSSSHYHSQQNQHYSNQQLSSSSAYYSQTPPTTPSRENTFKQFLSNTLQKKTHSKQFWMPDDRVTNCYECLTPFSVFKRKHHCRICGQIFCWKCSDYFIDGKKFGLSSKVRVCTYCYNLMKKDQSVENDNAKNDSSGGGNNTTANSTPNLLNSQRTTFSSMFTSSVAEDFDPSQQLNDPNDADGDGFEGGGSATNLLGGGDGFDSLGVGGGAGGNHSADEDSGDDDDDDEMIYQQATTTIFEDSLANSDILSSLHQQQQQQQQTVDNETVPFKIISGEEFEQGFDEHLNSIEESSQVHLKNIVLQLIQKENEENNQMIDKKWEEVIVGLALRTVNTVNPNMMRGDKMDITNYVKIKKVLGSNLLKSEYIDGGVVFTKNIIHKKMRSNLTNPKLLMLTCPISYQYHKADTLIASMDILISQEEEFLKLLVERIAEKKPDLVLCEKSVSRHAKELLLQKGISVAVNVKRRVLERISRCSGYPILSSIDEYNSSSTHQQLEPSISQAYVKRIGDKNLFIICGNQTDAQCTIVLRGENEKELELVKKIFKFAIYVAYNLKLETEFFFDQCGTLLHSKEDENTTNQPFILSASPHVKFPLKIKDLDLGKWNISSNLILNQKNQEECSELESSMFEKLLTPYAHQNIIVLFTKHPKIDPKVISNIENPSISPPETIVIAYYTENDMPLGKFLELRCFNKANLTNYLNTIRIYTHNEGKIILTIEKSSEIISSSDEGIAMWNYCKICERHVTPVIPMSDSAYKYSFGKFLESTFYNDSLKCRTGGCNHSVHHDHVRYFAYNDIIAKFEYKPVNVYNLVFPGNQITYDYNQQRNQFLILIQNVNDACQILFNDFNQLMSEISCNYSLLTQDQIIQVSELGEQIKNQQVSLWTTLETISQTKENIYTLNDFIRNVYISSLGWNDMIIELFSKFGMLKNNLNTKTSLVQNNSSLPSSSSSSSATSSGTKKNRETKISVQFIEENNRIKVILEELECGSVTVPLLNLDNVETMSTSSGSSATMVTSNSLSNFNSATNNNSTNNNINTSIALTVDTRIISPRSSENDTTTTTTNSEIVSPISTSRKSFNIFTFKNQNKQSSIFDQLQLKPVKLPNIIDSVSAHMFLPSGSNDANVIVYNDEPSTIIAYTLSSNDYYKFIPSKDDIDIESILKSKDKNHYKFSFYDTPNSTTSNKVTLINGAELPSNTSISSNPISGGRSKNKTKFSCTCFFSNQFSALRKAYCNGDDSFIHSLARCVKWTPTGGKKGSFTMSWDSRFVLKEVSRVELLSFLEIGHSYFEYVASSLYHELPIVLVKILGVFRLSYHDNKGKPIKKDVIVMDNLFYNRNISKRFDLKGSTRNRYQKTEGATLMDENLLEFICNGSPLVTREAFKSVLTISVFNDTLFLSKHNVMDYSLLVGIDEENGDIILGIIDYVRQYTWDKHFETWVKSAGIISNKGKVPTVISPKHYKTRFREAMQRYIVATCSKLTGLLS